jgi:glycosyltransferase involved in cell wall biosynthesis
MRRRLHGYIRWLQLQYSTFQWKRYFRRCRRQFEEWQHRFSHSDAQVLLGMHFHKQGGVRNHLLAIQRYSALKVLLVPEEHDLQSTLGPAFLKENRERFLQTAPPPSAVAVHTHVLPELIQWAERHAPGKLRWVHTHHALYQNEDGAGGVLPWQEELNRTMLHAAARSDICLCVSRWEQRQLQEQFGITVRYVPNGVDVTACDRSQPDRFRRRYRIIGDFLLWVGRLDPVKNPRAFVELAIRQPETPCVMIGGVTRQDVLREYGLETPSNLTLLPQLSHADVLDAIAACRALVVTSFREGLPTLVLEGMALRRPIVVPAEAGCLDATDGDRCAAVYEVDNPDHLQDRVQFVLREKADNEAGRQRVLQEFDWRVVAGKLDRIYHGSALP